MITVVLNVQKKVVVLDVVTMNVSKILVLSLRCFYSFLTYLKVLKKRFPFIFLYNNDTSFSTDEAGYSSISLAVDNLLSSSLPSSDIS